MSTPISTPAYPSYTPAPKTAAQPNGTAQPATPAGGYQPVAPKALPYQLKPITFPTNINNAPATQQTPTTAAPSQTTQLRPQAPNANGTYQPYTPPDTYYPNTQNPGAASASPTPYPDSQQTEQMPTNQPDAPPVKPLDAETEDSLAELNDRARQALHEHPEWADVINNVNSKEDIKALLDDPDSPPNDLLRKLDDYRVFRMSRKPISWIGRGLLLVTPQKIKPEAKDLLRWFTTKPPERTSPSTSPGDYFSSKRKSRYDDDGYGDDRSDRYDDYDSRSRSRYDDDYGPRRPARDTDRYGDDRPSSRSSGYSDYRDDSRYPSRSSNSAYGPSSNRPGYDRPERNTDYRSPRSDRGPSSIDGYDNRRNSPERSDSGYDRPASSSSRDNGFDRPPHREPSDTRIGPRRYPEDEPARSESRNEPRNTERDSFDDGAFDNKSDREDRTDSPSLKDRATSLRDRVKGNWDKTKIDDSDSSFDE